MGTPIVKGLTEVHHCVTYSPPQPLYELCMVRQPLRPTLRCDLLSGNYGTLPVDKLLDLLICCFVIRTKFLGDQCVWINEV